MLPYSVVVVINTVTSRHPVSASSTVWIMPLHRNSERVNENVRMSVYVDVVSDGKDKRNSE